MSDFLTTAFALQAEIIRAQQKQLKAGQAMLDASRQALAMQQAGQQLAEANLRAWKSWTALWGIR